MRVTDEMVEAGAKGFWEMVKRGAKWEDVSPSIREDWLMSSRAVLTAALSHAAGQEADYSAKFRHAGEWSRYPEGTRAHDIDGGFWLKIDRQWKWMPDGGTFPTPAASAFDVSVPAVARNDAAQPTTSAEVGRDADNVPKILMRAVNSANAAGAKDVANDIFSLMDKHWPIVVWSATSGRQGD